MIFKRFGKIILSALIAFIVLTAFCLLYFNVPVHYDCKDGATDYVWQKNKVYFVLTEGYSWGKTNNEGYSNTIDYEKGMHIDVLIMGSSQMEARNVPMKDSTAYLLSEKLGKTVYNIGVSEHYFLNCVDNLKAAADKYNPDCIVIETGTVEFEEENARKLLDGEYPALESHSGGIVGFIQKNPFLRCVYNQIKLSKANKSEENTSEGKNYADESMISEILEKVSKDAGNAKIIVLYQPGKNSNQDTGMFSKLCEKNGICFLDMTERFDREFEENRIYPHGFSNTSVGEGHLNKNGHMMIAEELYKFIEEEI